MSIEEARILRRRAVELRDFATTVERTPVLDLDRFAGDTTWQGSRPELCRALLHTNQLQLHSAIDAVRWEAFMLDQRAERLEADAALWDRTG